MCVFACMCALLGQEVLQNPTSVLQLRFGPKSLHLTYFHTRFHCKRKLISDGCLCVAIRSANQMATKEHNSLIVQHGHHMNWNAFES